MNYNIKTLYYLGDPSPIRAINLSKISGYITELFKGWGAVIYTQAGVNKKNHRGTSLKSERDHRQLFAKMSAGFRAEYNLDVKSLEIKFAKNVPENLLFNTYTVEKPKVDKWLKHNNTVRWLRLNFSDGTTTGWMCWPISAGTACHAISRADDILYYYAISESYRNLGQIARSRHIIATQNDAIKKK